MNNKDTDKTFFNIIEIFGFKSSREFAETLQNSSWKERKRLKGPWNCILERQHKISPTTAIEQTWQVSQHNAEKKNVYHASNGDL